MSDNPDEKDDGESDRTRGGLFVTDAELIRRLAVPEKIARDALRALDNHRGTSFPQKSKLWGNRRYWPAVSCISIRTMECCRNYSDQRRATQDR